MKRFSYLLLAALLTFGLVSAQDSDSSHHEGTHDEGHSDEYSDDTTSDDTTDEMNHDEDYSGHDTDDMATDELSDGEALNTVMLGEQSVALDPLITLDGSFTLGLRSEEAWGELTVNVTTPQGSSLSFDELSSSSLATLEFGQAEAGIYRFSGTHDGADFAFPVSVYRQTSGDAEAYLVLAPTPTLANRGESEVYANVVRNGENVHGTYALNRVMEGMTHSTDDDLLELAHTHFEDSYDEVLGEAPVFNQVPLSFPMVGTWQVNLDVTDGDSDETFFETFEIEMLED